MAGRLAPQVKQDSQLLMAAAMALGSTTSSAQGLIGMANTIAQPLVAQPPSVTPPHGKAHVFSFSVWPVSREDIIAAQHAAQQAAVDVAQQAAAAVQQNAVALQAVEQAVTAFIEPLARFTTPAAVPVSQEIAFEGTITRVQ